MADLTQEKFEEHMESFAKIVKEGFDATATKEDIAGVKEDIAGVKEDIAVVKQRLTKVEATMVTKEYLDDKLSDLRGDLTVLMRKEDTKVKWLIEKLHAKRVLDDRDVDEYRKMEPFPALAL